MVQPEANCSDSGENKKGTFQFKTEKSPHVPGTGVEPVRALQPTGF